MKVVPLAIRKSSWSKLKNVVDDGLLSVQGKSKEGRRIFVGRNRLFVK